MTPGKPHLQPTTEHLGDAATQALYDLMAYHAGVNNAQQHPVLYVQYAVDAQLPRCGLRSITPKIGQGQSCSAAQCAHVCALLMHILCIFREGGQGC